MPSSDNFFVQAITYLQAGRVDEAERSFKVLLQHEPKHLAAINLLGAIMSQRGRFAEAESYLKAALQLNSNSDATLYNYALVLKALKRPKEALERFTQALAINSTLAETWNSRGTVLNDLKRYNEAIADFEKALALQPSYAPAHYNKGNALVALKSNDQALAAYDQALTLRPDFAEAWLGRANTASILKSYDEALYAYDKALSLNPALSEAWLGRATTLVAQKLYDEALSAYSKALALDQKLIQAWLGSASVLSTLKRYKDALSACDKALALDSNLSEVWVGRGELKVALKRYEDALSDYAKALTLNPKLTPAWLGRGYSLLRLKLYDEAIEVYKVALALDSGLTDAWQGRSFACKQRGYLAEALNSVEEQIELTTPKNQEKRDHIIALGKAIFSIDCLPGLYDSELDLAEHRQGIAITMETIHRELDAITEGGEFTFPQSLIDTLFQSFGFFIPYQQQNDRDLMRSYSSALQRILKPDQATAPRMARSSRKIRFGIVSELLMDHPGSRFAYEWVAHLPKDDYEFFSYALQGETDEATKKFEKLGAFKHLPFGPSSFQNTIATMKADNLHFLLYPDVGMSASSRILSQYRLAAIQLASWGHPVTTGSPNIDYFLSGELLEIPDAHNHYTEKLIRLPNSSRFIVRNEVKPRDAPAFDLPRDRILYGSLQSLFKLLPQYNSVWPKIAKRLPSAYFVFIEGDPSFMTKSMEKRLARAFAQEGLNANEYVTFLPRMDGKRYAALMHAIQVNIDSIGWSGGYTTVESLEAACPIVTLPTELMRGRHSYSIIKMMGLDELIATSLDDFIDRLVMLGAEADWRHAVKEKISQNSYRLFQDWSVIEALDKFLKGEFAKLTTEND